MKRISPDQTYFYVKLVGTDFKIDSNTAINAIKELGESLTVVPSDFNK